MKTIFETTKYTKYTKRLLVCFVYFVVNSLFAATKLDDMSGTNELYTASETDAAIAGKADATNTYTKAETDAAIVRLAPAPGNYPTVSNAAMNALSRAEAEAGFTEWEVRIGSPGTKYDGWRSIVFADGHWTVRIGEDPEDPEVYSLTTATDPDATLLEWRSTGGFIVRYRAARVRLPTMADSLTTNDVCAIVTNEVDRWKWVYYGLPEGATVVRPPFRDGDTLSLTIEMGGEEQTGYCCDRTDDIDWFGFYDNDSFYVGAAHRVEHVNTLGLARLEDLPPLTNGLASASLLANIAESLGGQVSEQSRAVATLGSQVNAIGAHLNAEDAHFVSTNYDSAVRLPEAYVEIKMRDQATGDESWITIWREMRRWTAFVGSAFDWGGWGGFHDWATNVMAELAFKADRAWGAYDSETGGYSPEGYTQISSSNILIAAGMAYQRTVTSAGAVWVLQCNQGAARIGGDAGGFFRVADGDGVTQFEIVKGDRREMGADASGVTYADGTLVIRYSVEAAEHPTIRCCGDLATANWKDQTDDDCPCWVAWHGTSGAWVARVTPKTAQPSMFVKATYMAGGESYIKNVAPVSVGGGILCTDGVHKCRPVYGSGGSITWEVVQ